MPAQYESTELGIAADSVPLGTIRRQFIPVTGTVIELAEPMTLTEIREQLRARVLEGITLVQWGIPLHTMLINDQSDEERGRNLRGKAARVNLRATALYRANCKPGTKRQIRGDVLIVPDQDFTYQLPLE